MRTTYDKTADAAYIYLNEKEIEETKEISDSIYVDYDRDQNIVGIEILDFSSTVSQKELKNLFKIGIPFTVSRSV